MKSDRNVRRHDREAAEWFARLNDKTVSVSDLEKFKAWRSDPTCREAYSVVETVWRRSAGLAADPDIQTATHDVASRSVRARSRRRLWLFAGIPAVAACAMAAWFVTTAPQVYQTGVGERRVVRLKDGSEVQLDSSTRVEVRYGAQTRNLTLDRGQALFEVAHDPSRPFRVSAGAVRVEALGTRFDVRRDGKRTQVTLVRGAVEVLQKDRPSGWRLAPGEQIVADAARPHAATTARKVDASAVTRWTEGRLVFDATPLATAVAEMNRYADKPIRLDAAGFADKPVSGEFESSNDDAFAEAVARIYGLRVVTAADGGLSLVAQTS